MKWFKNFLILGRILLEELCKAYSLDRDCVLCFFLFLLTTDLVDELLDKRPDCSPKVERAGKDDTYGPFYRVEIYDLIFSWIESLSIWVPF